MSDPISPRALEDHIARASAAAAPMLPSSRAALMRMLSAGRGAVLLLSAVIWLCPPVAALAGWMMLETAVPARSIASMAGLAVLGLIALAVMVAAWMVRADLLARTARMLDACVPAMLAERRVDPVAADHLGAVRAFLTGPVGAALLDVPGVVLAALLLCALAPMIGLVLLAATGAFVIIAWRSARAPATDGDASAKPRFDVQTLAALRLSGMRCSGRRVWLPALIRAGQGPGDVAAIRDRVLARAAMMGIWLALFVAGGWMAMVDRASIPLVAAAQALALISVQPLLTLLARTDALLRLLRARRMLSAWLDAPVPVDAAATLAAPREQLSCDIALLSAPGQDRALLSNIRFTLRAGEVLAVAGPGGAGKSVLMRALVGDLSVAIGDIRLDGAQLNHWSDAMLDREIGYLPQVPMLAAGTVAENIARFAPQTSSEAVLAAARAAGAHDAIVALPGGYDTQVGDGGACLSHSMRQRIALARACFGDPFVMLLDSPAAGADQRAIQALQAMIDHARQRGAVVVVVAQDAPIIERADRVLVLRDGRVAAFAPPSELRARTRRDAQNSPTPISQQD